MLCLIPGILVFHSTYYIAKVSVSFARWRYQLVRHMHELGLSCKSNHTSTQAGSSYTLWVKKLGHSRPITLEILNRSLPNLAQIKVSSFWTSCQSLF